MACWSKLTCNRNFVCKAAILIVRHNFVCLFFAANNNQSRLAAREVEVIVIAFKCCKKEYQHRNLISFEKIFTEKNLVDSFHFASPQIIWGKAKWSIVVCLCFFITFRCNKTMRSWRHFACSCILVGMEVNTMVK